MPKFIFIASLNLIRYSNSFVEILNLFITFMLLKNSIISFLLKLLIVPLFEMNNFINCFNAIMLLLFKIS